MPAFLQQYKSAGVTAPVMGAATDLPQSAATASKGVVSVETYLPDRPPFTGYTGSQYLVEQYKKVPSDEPNHEVAVGYTYAQTYDRVSRLSSSLRAMGVRRGDRSRSCHTTRTGSSRCWSPA